jgi:hypothetical protein
MDFGETPGRLRHSRLTHGKIKNEVQIAL